MTIDRHNYEIFLIDYLDGKLTPSQVQELMAFLNINPDIKDEFEGIKDTIVEGEQILFPHKPALKKEKFIMSGIESEFDYLCISSIEGDISPKEEHLLAEYFAADEKWGKEFQLYKHTKLSPNKEEKFQHKNFLKRAKIIHLRVGTLRVITTAAAAMLLFLGSYTTLRLINQETIKGSLKKPVVISSNQPAVMDSPAKPIEIKANPPANIEQVGLNKQNLAKNTTNADFRKLDSVIVPLKTIDVSSLETKPLKIEKMQVLPNNYYAGTKVKSQRDNNLASYQGKSSVREIGLFELAQMGLSSFGKLIGRDIRLDAQRNKNGAIKKIEFESSLIAFSAPIGKNDE